MSSLDTFTDADVTSLRTKCAQAIWLAEFYNALAEAAMENPGKSYDFLKKEARRKIDLGIVKHSYTEEQPPETESLDG